MKIDANANGGVDWDEFTSFMLTLDEGTTAMAAAATMLDLVLDEPFEKRRDSLGGLHKDMITRILNVERPGLSAYVTAGRDGTVRFWHKATLNHLKCIDHGDSVRRHFKKLVQA
eukprot:7419-Heterococcus_DN1.PRE.1